MIFPSRPKLSDESVIGPLVAEMSEPPPDTDKPKLNYIDIDGIPEDQLKTKVLDQAEEILDKGLPMAKATTFDVKEVINMKRKVQEKNEASNWQAD